MSVSLKHVQQSILQVAGTAMNLDVRGMEDMLSYLSSSQDNTNRINLANQLASFRQKTNEGLDDYIRCLSALRMQRALG